VSCREATHLAAGTAAERIQRRNTEIDNISVENVMKNGWVEMSYGLKDGLE